MEINENIYNFIESYQILIASLAATLVTFIYFLWLNYRSKTFNSGGASLDKQSYEVENGVRGSLVNNGKLMECYFSDVSTTHEAFLRGMRVSNNGPCYGTQDKNTKKYKWITYNVVINRAHQIGSSFILKGLKPQDTTHIGIYAKNCVEWAITSEACAMFSMVTVPLYDTLGHDSCKYIIKQTEIEIVICDNWNKINFLLNEIDSIPSLKIIVYIHNEEDENIESKKGIYTKNVIGSGDKLENLNEEVASLNVFKIYIKEAAKKAKVEIISFDQLLNLGQNNLQDMVLATPETINTITYTSGTTGIPKGVILTHKAMIANASGLIAHGIEATHVDSNDVYISYLPLAHVFERLNQIMLICFGIQIGFSSGDVKYLLNDLALLKPTIFPTIPRLLNRIYNKIMQNVSKNIFKKSLLNFAIYRKMSLLKRGIISNNTIWDKLLFRKIQLLLGGRVRVCVTGSAPLSSPVLNFTRASFGCFVFVGYGQTEVAAGSTLTLPDEVDTDTVGAPLPNCNIKLIDIPEMGYYSKDNKGEICIKSTSNFSGYFKDHDKTIETLDDNGYVHTGDVGEWNANGSLKIIDRKKHMFKLSQGEYISPEKIEHLFMLSPFVAQVFVDGDSKMDFPLAIIVPESEYLENWAKNHLQTKQSLKDLCLRKEIKQIILEDLNRISEENKLNRFEMVKDIFLHPKLFTVEENFLTPTMKIKRSVLRQHFMYEFNTMYKSFK